jgi:IMP dehydrogenase
MKILPEQNLTFDDVLLLPQESKVLPRDIKLKINLAKEFSLNIPLISADMDTVTESSLAIALARLGGLGVIHKNLSPDKQAQEVNKVKRSETSLITDPITLGPEETVEKAVEIMEQNNISGIPIIKNKKLVGILTHRDLRFIKNERAQIKEVMTKKLITAPLKTTIEKAKTILHKHRIEKLLLVNENGELKGLITAKDIQKLIDYPLASKDKDGRLRVAASIGVGKEALVRAEKSIKANADCLAISTAHGHSKMVVETIKKIRKKYPKTILMAGNVATKEGVRTLARAGAHLIKVGIGPGSTCTTRAITGGGVPQLTAILECSKEAQKNKVGIIADGGIRYSGDIVKALAAGARAVMIGNLFAGTEEAPGELIYYKNKAYKSYRGMGSLGALKKGSRERYNQQGNGPAKLVPEGIEGRVLYKGLLIKVVEQLTGGLRSGMGLSGAKSILDLQKKAKFILVTKHSLEESHPHNIAITEQAPNYPGRV